MFDLLLPRELINSIATRLFMGKVSCLSTVRDAIYFRVQQSCHTLWGWIRYNLKITYSLVICLLNLLVLIASLRKQSSARPCSKTEIHLTFRGQSLPWDHYSCFVCLQVHFSLEWVHTFHQIHEQIWLNTVLEELPLHLMPRHGPWPEPVLEMDRNQSTRVLVTADSIPLPSESLQSEGAFQFGWFSIPTSDSQNSWLQISL